MALYPSSTLYPAEDLYPAAQETESVGPSKFGFSFGFPFGFRQIPTTKVGVSNTGTVASPPVLTLVGPLTDPAVEITSQAGLRRTLTFDGSVAAGDELVIDTAAQTVLLNGTVNRRNLLVTSQSRWFELPPGDSTLTLTAASSGAGAGLRVAWRSAYE